MLLKLFFILNIIPRLSAAQESQTLCRGESLLVKKIGANINLSEPGYVKVISEGSLYRLIGIKKGSVNLRGSNITKVTITDCIRHSQFKEIQSLLKNSLGPSLQLSGDNIEIVGELLSFEDWEMLTKIPSTLKNVVMKSTPVPEVEKKIIESLNFVARNNNLPLPSVSFSPQFSIYVSNKDQNIFKIYESVFSPLGFLVISHAGAVSKKPLIDIKILAVEIKKHKLSEIGLSWPTSMQWDLVTKSIVGENLFVNAKLFEDSGMGHVLASPNLVTESGQEATFHSGGEFPAKSASQFRSQITWKKYGILLKINPTVENLGHIAISLDCEISNIDNTHSVEGIPALVMHKISSSYNLKDGQTISLSGLIKSSHEKNKSGIPILKDIPVFDSLFSSETYSKDESELIFFVTSRVSQNAD